MIAVYNVVNLLPMGFSADEIRRHFSYFWRIKKYITGESFIPEGGNIEIISDYDFLM